MLESRENKMSKSFKRKVATIFSMKRINRQGQKIAMLFKIKIKLKSKSQAIINHNINQIKIKIKKNILIIIK